MGGWGFFAESAFVDFGVQGGEKQVLQDGPVVGIAGVRVVVFQQAGDLGLVEQVVGNQSLFFDEPDEQQSRDEADDVFFGREGFRFVGGEAGRGDGVLEPGEQVFVELPVEFFGIQHGQPRGQQAVEVARFAVVVCPLQPIGQG